MADSKYPETPGTGENVTPTTTTLTGRARARGSNNRRWQRGVAGRDGDVAVADIDSCCTPWIKNGLIDKDRLLALRRRRSFFAGHLPLPRGGLWARF